MRKSTNDIHTNPEEGTARRSRNARFRWAASPAPEAEHEYRVVVDIGLTARNPDLAARYPDVNLGGPVTFVERRSLRPKQEWHLTMGAVAVGVGLPLAGWAMWHEGSELLGVLVAILGLLLGALSFLFPVTYWEMSPGTPLRLAEELADSPQKVDSATQIRDVPHTNWAQLDQASVSQ